MKNKTIEQQFQNLIRKIVYTDAKLMPRMQIYMTSQSPSFGQTFKEEVAELNNFMAPLQIVL